METTTTIVSQSVCTQFDFPIKIPESSTENAETGGAVAFFTESQNPTEAAEITQIYLKLSEHTEKDTGYSLHTTENGHFIKENGTQAKDQSFNLRDNDRLLAINREPVVSWDHWIVLDSFKYLALPSDFNEQLSLTIERRDSQGKVNCYEICITVIKARGRCIVEIKSFLKRISYTPRLRCVKFIKLFQCKIRHGSRTNYYLKANEKMSLTLEPLKYEDGNTCLFDCYMYQALRFCSSRAIPPTSVFICVLRSCYSIKGQRPYILARNCETIGLLNCSTLILDGEKIEKADPRFFRVTKTSNGNSILESLLYKDYFLTWTDMRGDLRLTKRGSVEMIDALNISDCQFQILSETLV